jgi:hypothetical protein
MALIKKLVFLLNIISDILDPVLQPDPTLMNRAFWRQNITFNKPAPFGAKLSGAFHWNCSTPFFILDPFL